eukprot:6029111-Amphidinium_carterae.1
MQSSSFGFHGKAIGMLLWWWDAWEVAVIVGCQGSVGLSPEEIEHIKTIKDSPRVSLSESLRIGQQGLCPAPTITHPPRFWGFFKPGALSLQGIRSLSPWGFSQGPHRKGRLSSWISS